jgi:hypothetical protein
MRRKSFHDTLLHLFLQMISREIARSAASRSLSAALPFFK